MKQDTCDTSCVEKEEAVRLESEEFSDVQEVYRRRRSIIERLLGDADQWRWR